MPTIQSIATRFGALRDERGVALMSVMLFMILLTGMSLVLLSVIMGQIGPSYLAQKGTKTVYAAQAGLQSALGVVRSASSTTVDPSGNVFGDPAKLPCGFSGSLDPAPAEVSYAVTIQYFVDDPTGHVEPWLSANDLNCTTLATGQPGGVRNALNALTSPQYAYIVSRATATSAAGRSATEGDRAVAAVYKFKVRNINVPGGRILAPSTGECMQAQALPASTAIGVGSLIKFVPAAQCTADKGPHDLSQLWLYSSTYQIKLASSTDGATPGLCITGLPASPGNNATLQTCLTTDARYSQLWSWTGDKTWQGQSSTISAGVTASYLTQSGAGSNLKVSTTRSNTFAPTPAVGAGNAGKDTKQIVNYKEFGRCLDVTGARITDPFMIAYPCKQDPSGTGTPPGTGKLDWNHKWWYTETATTLAGQQIYVYTTYDASGAGVTANRRCLETPETGKYPVFKTCTKAVTETATGRQSWTRVYAAADYASSYLIKDSTGRCLTADASDLFDDASGNLWSKITVATCTSNENQKWNAPPNDALSTFDGYRELG